jgi:hypothetical protein
MTKEEIKAAILKVAGNPESGPIAEYANAWAEELHRLSNPKVETKKFEPVKETRVQEIKETR